MDIRGRKAATLGSLMGRFILNLFFDILHFLLVQIPLLAMRVMAHGIKLKMDSATLSLPSFVAFLLGVKL